MIYVMIDYHIIVTIKWNYQQIWIFESRKWNQKNYQEWEKEIDSKSKQFVHRNGTIKV